MSFWDILWGSLPDNWYIILNAGISAVACAFSIVFAVTVKKCFEPNGSRLEKANYYILDITYTLFTAMISIFPLLGMFGTVAALLSIDMTQEFELLQANFFYALTSTAWGIVGAILFKLINAGIQPFVENQIAKAKEVLDIGGTNEQKSSNS